LSGSAALQNLEFEWDLAGNLEQRVVRNAAGTPVATDVFGYDALDRLETVTRDSTEILSLTYDALGNIDTKAQVSGLSGTYVYGGSRPHAVTAIGAMTFGYDANGNMTNRDGTTLTWTSFNLPSRIERPSGEYSEFLYGADRSRYQQIEGVGAIQSTRHYASPGLFEVLTWNGGASRRDYHYIHANGRAVAQFTTSNAEADELLYLHRDHQGGVVLTTDTNGDELDRFEYDPFGVRTTTVGSDERVHRGYTGHEHLAALDLVHMNGRVQDPVLGRFLSPDPFVQAPYFSQSLNRYSYVWNNPMSLVDPSGFQPDDRLPPVPCELTLTRGGSWTCQGPNLPPIVDENRTYSSDVPGDGGDAYAAVNASVRMSDFAGAVSLTGARLRNPLPWECDFTGCYNSNPSVEDVLERMRSLGPDPRCILVGDNCSRLERAVEIASVIPAARPLKVLRGVVKRMTPVVRAARIDPVPNGVRTGPAPNNGIARPHGGARHNDAIDQRVEALNADPAVTNVRKNQVQVDVNGNRAGNNRPDVQYDQCGVHHCVEYDTIPGNSARHGDVIRQNDPNAVVELNVL
jgi:RHS repeat-associated protein